MRLKRERYRERLDGAGGFFGDRPRRKTGSRRSGGFKVVIAVN